MEQKYLENSFIGRLGHFVEPVMQPLGFDWKISISIITGLAAKEVVVGTIGVLYQGSNNESAASASLANRLKNQVHSSGPHKGEQVFTPLSPLFSYFSSFSTFPAWLYWLPFAANQAAGGGLFFPPFIQLP